MLFVFSIELKPLSIGPLLREKVLQMEKISFAADGRLAVLSRLDVLAGFRWAAREGRGGLSVQCGSFAYVI